jgi:hyaluronoglucosaminidase
MSDARDTSASPFAVRGVIEGFYGHPWTHEQRLRLVDELSAQGMNAFMCSPKDDPRVRRDWRIPYEGADREALAELAARCRQRGVALTWCISPGLSIRYSDARDVEALTTKVAGVVALGIGQVGLFLDDIPMELQHPQDREAFADLEEAHGRLIDRVFSALPPGVRLIVCPTIYWGTGTEPYLASLAQRLDPRIDLLWTGRAICSPTLELADASTFMRTTNRPPTYWDNYPVNDVAMGYELHIGPYRGRDPHLWRAATGIVANGMELFEASRIPFATIADYLRDPEGYEPEASWQRAQRVVVGEADLEAFTLFADNVRSSCLSSEDAPIVSAALDRARFRYQQGDREGAAADLAALADRLVAAAAHLLRGPVANQSLIDEVRPWLEAFEAGAEGLRRIAQLMGAGRLDADGPSELRPFQIRLRRARVRVYGDALEMTLSALTGTMFRPGEVP